MKTIAFWLSLAVVFTIPWENAVTIGDLGTLSRFLGILTAVAWLGSFVVKPRICRAHPFHLAMFVFVLWNAASLYWSQADDRTLLHIKTYVQLAFLAWILWDLYTTRKALMAALQAYILGAYLTIGGTIYNYINGMQIDPYSTDRYSGVGLNAVEVAIILTIGLPIAWHFVTSLGDARGSRILWMLNYAYIPVSLFAITLTASRTFLVAVIPFVLFVLCTSARIKLSARIFIIAVLLGASGLVLYYAPQAEIERLATISKSIAALDFGGRRQVWMDAMHLFVEHPFLGIGSGALRDSSILGAAAHNSFLSIAAELGLVGIFIYGYLLVVVMREAVSQPKGLSRLWMTIFAIWLIGCCTLTWEFAKPTWLFLSLIVISANVVDKRSPLPAPGSHPLPLRSDRFKPDLTIA